MAWIDIETLDGDGRFKAWLAEPEGTPRGAIVVIQEIFGVNAGIRSKCDHWASLGYLGLGPDLFWRLESGVELDPDVPDQFQTALGLMQRLDQDKGIADIEATIRAARARLPAGGRVGCVGYCLGGRLAYMTAARTDIDASVGYYGVGLEGLLGEKHAIARPLMLHIAGADHFVTPDKQALIHQGLDDHPRVTIHDYPGEDHGFATEIGQAPQRGRGPARRPAHRGVLRRAYRVSAFRPGSARLAGRFAVPLLLLALSLAAAWRPLRPLLIVTLPLLAVAIFDFLQRRHTLWRNYPLIARVRWLMEDLRPFLRAYIVESDLDGRPFNIDQRALVYARAKGDLDAHPFGTELDVYSDEYEWIGHSMAPNADAPAEWRVAVGGPQCAKPYEAALLNVSAMSFGALGARAIEALNLGARRGGFYHDTGEGGLSRYHRRHGGDLVWEIGSGYFGCCAGAGRFDEGRYRDFAQDDQVKMVEIKLSQGAKPGHGGLLPAAKVSAEIAAARGVPEGEDCVSPAAHSTFSTPIGLLEWAARLRELSGGKPVGAKLCVGQPHEVFALMKAMRETGILLDFLVVDGGEGGTGAAPVELSDRVGMPLREGLILVRNALVGASLKDKVRLAASGKVHSGAGLAVNFGLGADWCNAARAFMFALGCVQSMRCHTDTCPTGITTQDASRQRGLVVEDKAARVARYQHQTLEGLREIVVAMGLENPWQIRPHHIRERVNSAHAATFEAIHPFLDDGALLDEPEATPYGREWAAARADSFRAAA